MTFNKILSILIFTFMVSCRANHKRSDINLIGSYSTKSMSKIEWIYYHYFNKTMFSTGSTLILKSDSTYILTNCGNLISGQWNLSNDSILLYCKKNTWINDSLNKVRPLGCGNGPQVFIVKENGDLLDRFTIEDKRNSKSIPAATWLEKD